MNLEMTMQLLQLLRLLWMAEVCFLQQQLHYSGCISPGQSFLLKRAGTIIVLTKYLKSIKSVFIVYSINTDRMY